MLTKNKILLFSKQKERKVKMTTFKVTYLGFERYMKDPNANMHATCLKIFAGQQSIAIQLSIFIEWYTFFSFFILHSLSFFILQASKSELQLHRNSHQFLENQSLVMSSHQHHKSESKLLDNSDYNNLIHDTNTEVSLVTGNF